MEEKFKNIRTPSEFYRSIRPEFFSDSEIIYEIKLTREILEFELSNISKNQKQDLFESFSRKLAEKYISPNLIPQVGPTGGGDGKVDSETHPVSKFIAERWFISETNWDSGDKWAFAISAKTDWKEKVKSDVRKIVGTKRGYNQIFFFTNQAPSSKKKKECEKELKDEFNIDVAIIDREWMLEKVYTNNLQELAVTTLNLSSSYLSKKEVKGKNDKERNQRLEELELNISNPNRYFEYDLQLVEDALEAAILSRKLEKAKDEVIGKFNRAATFCEKTNNPKQWLRVLYQKAFTLLNYYDDYEAFVNSFIEFKSKFPEEPIFAEIELYNNLFNLLQGLLSSDIPEIGKLNIDIKLERKEFFEVLEKAETNENFKTTSIIAKTYRLVQELVLILKQQNDLSKLTKELSSILKEGDKHLDYPFESIVKVIERLGQVVPDDLNFDNLVDRIAEINSTRVSELSSGLTYFNRGRQKLLADANAESIKYFGKAAYRLVKEDSQEELYLCLTGMAIAYKSLGLLWAANNCLYFAGSIAFKAWYQNGTITTRIKNIVHQLLVNELFIGRIPIFLVWNELYEIVRNQLNISSDEDIERPSFIDACLAVRLLNSHEGLGLSINFLPDILKSQTLHISEDTCSYILGLYDKLKVDYSELETMSSNEKIDEFFNKIYNQPFKDQMLYKTSLLDGENSTIQSIILGCTIKITFKTKSTYYYLQSSILHFLSHSFPLLL